MVYNTKGRLVFNILNYLFFILFSLSIMLPFLNVISLSLSSFAAVSGGKVGLLPVGFNLEGYRAILGNNEFMRSFATTASLTIINTTLVILLSLMAGYALTSKHLPGKNIIFTYILIPLYIQGGLIPYYLLVNSLNLNNRFGALIFPLITNVFYIIVFRNSINGLPKDLMESAEIDGASEYVVLFRIVMPLVIPMLTAFIIFSAVQYWNEWYHVLLFIGDRSKWTLQYKLRDILSARENNDEWKIKALVSIHPKNIRMAALMVTVIPIIIVYPFLQRYFIHGVIVGAVKE